MGLVHFVPRFCSDVFMDAGGVVCGSVQGFQATYESHGTNAKCCRVMGLRGGGDKFAEFVDSFIWGGREFDIVR